MGVFFDLGFCAATESINDSYDVHRKQEREQDQEQEQEQRQERKQLKRVKAKDN